MNNIQVKKRREFYTTKDFPKLLTLEENFKGILNSNQSNRLNHINFRKNLHLITKIN